MEEGPATTRARVMYRMRFIGGIEDGLEQGPCDGAVWAGWCFEGALQDVFHYYVFSGVDDDGTVVYRYYATSGPDGEFMPNEIVIEDCGEDS
jgi:hypothetical protein